MNGGASNAEIFSSLGMAVFEQEPSGRLKLFEPPPSWLMGFVTGTVRFKATDLIGIFPFLSSFLDDATEHWESGSAERLRSGPWIQADRSGQEQPLVALAVRTAEKRFLVIEKLGELFEERRAALQAARERGLANERLGRQVESLAVEKEQIEQRNREVERMSQLKNDFMASMSHELRTPLNAIIGFSKLLLEERSGPLNAKQQRFLGHVDKSANHLLELINDVLDLSKIEAGYERLDRVELALGEILEEVRDEVRPLADAKGISLSLAGEPAVSVVADRARLKQILYNLVSNAVKFTPAGGLVELSSAESGGGLLVEVRDNGVGIPPEERETVFEKFHQVGAATKGVREGTGLGLAITKSLVELHGGRIWVEEAGGGGSRFLFTLPQADVAAADAATEAARPAGEKRRASEAGRPLRPSVGVVEDDEASGALLTEMLSDEYQVTLYPDGLAAMDGFSKERPDVVLLDISLPGIDGLEVLRRMRLQASLRDVPAIAISAHAAVADRERFTRAGFCRSITKPITDSHLLRRTIAESLRRPRL